MEYFKPCTKCGGSGEYYGYSTVSGTCFACRGSGRIFASAAAKRAFKAEKAAEATTFLVDNSKWLTGVAFFYAATSHPIAGSILSWARKGKMPTEKMLAATYKACVRHLVKLSSPPAVTVPVVEGKGITIEGKVLSVKWKESRYGGALKMLVEEARGFKVWGSVPKALSDVERGETIRFVANVEASDSDASFGFFKRPRKATLLSAELLAA